MQLVEKINASASMSKNGGLIDVSELFKDFTFPYCPAYN
jgi:hypothetical protein